MIGKNLIVLIAHYNNLEGLEKTLLSIDEPFDVDIMIVDDGSETKPTLNHLKSIYTKGEVFLELLPKNQGVGIAANHGLSLIQKMDYELIARLDCGDLNKPNKYQKQLDYLNRNPDVMVLGTWADIVNENGDFMFVLEFPTEYEKIKKKMFVNSMFINPTVIFRKKILDTIGLYKYEYRHAAQDYAFYFDAVKKFKCENLPESLLVYVIEEKSISTQKRKLQVKNRIKIILNHFEFGFYPIYSLLRNSFLYFISRDLSNKLKKLTNFNNG
ncbi:glycosyltransferase [Moheibacter stercoris]|uniref:Glycosyltransferase 2-like domain-containing protein n=1 Tax=Moheibacter stercoris TaxID=1628251 RepID=A0ABV2LVK3_9FLAO